MTVADRIYIIGPDDGPQKIGVAKKPKERCKSLQTGHPQLLMVHTSTLPPKGINARKIESLAHQLLADHRTYGEWFDTSVDMAKEAISKAKGMALRGEKVIPSRDNKHGMTPVQCKMARTATDMSINDLSKLSSISPNTISNFERGKSVHTITINTLKDAILSTGEIRFEGEHGVFAAECLGSSDIKKADQYNELGKTLYKLERYKEAESAYRQAIDVNPEYAAAHYNLGELLYGLKCYEESEVVYRQAINIDPKYWRANSRLGDVLCALKRYEEAEAAYRKAIKIDRGCYSSYKGLGEVLGKLKRSEEAIEAHRKAAKIMSKWNRDRN